MKVNRAIQNVLFSIERFCFPPIIETWVNKSNINKTTTKKYTQQIDLSFNIYFLFLISNIKVNTEIFMHKTL